ncbi:hypothetical protein [Azospirillum canadense]|uniref:hypothetical protein n=1 Tax=Azospirillum canadense TaxID=403962 RepID=UPI002227C781|nr:hypothetical protein [Azospirillum canadense]MCW2239647.1 hypothetical protein [Azospirillum canadense]
MAVQVVLIAADGEREVHEVARLDCGDLAPETLGLSLAEAKAITGSCIGARIPLLPLRTGFDRKPAPF